MISGTSWLHPGRRSSSARPPQPEGDVSGRMAMGRMLAMVALAGCGSESRGLVLWEPKADAADNHVTDAGVGPDSGVEGSAADAGGGSPQSEAAAICGQGIPTGQTAFASVVGACMLAIGCDPHIFPTSISECITNNALQAAGSFACLSTITSCTATTNSFYSCMGVRYATASECLGSMSACDAVHNLAIDCHYPGFTGIVTDCARTGFQCRTYTDADNNSRAGCAVADPCPLGRFGAQQCSNNNLYACVPSGDGGVGFGRSCAGATCSTTVSGDTGCHFDGNRACNSPGSVACNGNTLQACTSAGQAFNYDCTRAGGSCAAGDGGTSGCVSPGCSLSSTCTESCDHASNTLTVCVGGAPYPVSCTQYGFSSCGTDRTGNVYCSP